MEAYGVKIDLLNMQWIYRSKKYYHMVKQQHLRTPHPGDLPSHPAEHQGSGGGGKSG